MRASNDAPLNPLILIPSDAVPTGRREAHARMVKVRRETVGRAISCGAMFGLCAVFCLFYGGFCAFAWANHGHPLFGIVLAIFCGITFIGSGRLGALLAAEIRKIVDIPEPLRQEAETEALLEQARLDANREAIFWNDAARAAVDVDGLSDVILVNLVRQRVSIARLQREFRTGLSRFIAATSPKPRAVPPLDPWGHSERVSLDDKTP